MKPKYQSCTIALLLILLSQVFNACAPNVDGVLQPHPKVVKKDSVTWSALVPNLVPFEVSSLRVSRISVRDMTMIVIESSHGGLAVVNYSKDSLEIALMKNTMPDY